MWKPKWIYQRALIIKQEKTDIKGRIKDVEYTLGILLLPQEDIVVRINNHVDLIKQKGSKTSVGTMVSCGCEDLPLSLCKH